MLTDSWVVQKRLCTTTHEPSTGLRSNANQHFILSPASRASSCLNKWYRPVNACEWTGVVKTVIAPGPFSISIHFISPGVYFVLCAICVSKCVNWVSSITLLSLPAISLKTDYFCADQEPWCWLCWSQGNLISQQVNECFPIAPALHWNNYEST